MTSRSGVLLVGHGTRDAAGTDEFFVLSDRLADALGDTAVVRPCLLEFQKPDIAQAYASLMRARCHDVIVAPLLLFAAGHAKSDIPGEIASAVAAEAARCDSRSAEPVRIRYARPITRQAAIIDAVRARLRETLCREQSPVDWADHSDECCSESRDQRIAIVMVGRGSRDPCATSDMRVLSETAIRGRHNGSSIADEFSIRNDGVYTTFYAMASPGLPETLQHAAAGGFDRIVVHPHLLFSGRLYDAIVEQVKASAKQHPHIRFDVSNYLGPTAAVANALAARIRRAV